MKTSTIAAIGAALVATVTVAGVSAANAGGWGMGGRGDHHGMMQGAGPMGGMGMGGMGMGGMGGPMRMMQEFDTDKDGKLTQAEIDAARKAKFAEANKDGQGGVTIQEFEPFFWAQHREMMVRAFQMMDADGDGQVTEAEIAERTADMVSRMDRNGDGAISAEDRPQRGDGDRGWRRGDREGGDRGWRWGWGDEGDRPRDGMGPREGMGPRGQGGPGPEGQQNAQ